MVTCPAYLETVWQVAFHRSNKPKRKNGHSFFVSMWDSSFQVSIFPRDIPNLRQWHPLLSSLHLLGWTLSSQCQSSLLCTADTWEPRRSICFSLLCQEELVNPLLYASRAQCLFRQSWLFNSAQSQATCSHSNTQASGMLSSSLEEQRTSIGDLESHLSPTLYILYCCRLIS